MQVNSLGRGVPTSAQEKPCVDIAAAPVAAWAQPHFPATPRRQAQSQPGSAALSDHSAWLTQSCQENRTATGARCGTLEVERRESRTSSGQASSIDDDGDDRQLFASRAELAGVLGLATVGRYPT